MNYNYIAERHLKSWLVFARWRHCCT